MLIRLLIVSGVAAGLAACSFSAPDGAVTIDGKRDRGPATSYVGWIHGFGQGDLLDPTLVTPLNTQSWRIGNWWQYDQAAKYSRTVTFVLSDTWGYGRRPSDDWTAWEQHCKDQVRHSIEQNKPVTYWDIWNEPDHGAFWHWSYDDLLQTFKHARDAVKSVDPNAQVMGPSFAVFHGRANHFAEGTIEFVQDLDSKYGVRLDLVSWHENEELPWRMPIHANQLRSAFSRFEPAYAPPFNINEYTKPPTILKSAVVAWSIYNLDKAGIAFANLACWDSMHTQCAPAKTFSTCWKGLNGCFMDDNVTPMQDYWVWLFHAKEVEGGVRLVTEGPDYRTFAVASRHDADKAIQMFVGRLDFGHKAGSVTVTIKDYPYPASSVIVEKSCLPNIADICGTNPDNAIAKPWPQGPVPAATDVVPVQGRDVIFTIPNFPDMMVYFVKVTQQS